MTTGSYDDDTISGVAGRDPVNKFGIVVGHAYSLIGASEVTLNNG
jgi:hypothetical protein